MKEIIIDIEGYISAVKGERCNQCSEESPYEEETQRTIEVARKLGVWPEPLRLHRHLSKNGRGLVFRVSADLEKQLNLDEHKQITVTKLGNKIVLEAVS